MDYSYLKEAQKDVLGRCFNLCRYPDEAKELYQEVILNVHAKDHLFANVHYYKAYCYKAAKNIYLNLRKKQTREPPEEFDAESPYFNPFQFVLKNEICDLYKNAPLTSIQRSIMDLVIKDLNDEEISDTLHLTMKQVYANKYKARIKLIKYFEQNGYSY